MASAQTKRKFHNLSTPPLVLVWPKLDVPSLGTKEFPKAAPGVYETKGQLKFDDPRTKAFLKKLEPLHMAAFEKGKIDFSALPIGPRKALEKKGGLVHNPFYAVVYDKETEEDTGLIEFKFAMSAGGVFKTGPKAGQSWRAKPVVLDAKANTIARVPAIWGGTKAIIAFSVEEGGYFIGGSGACGIKLKLEAVQILDLVLAGQRSAASMGLTAQEGYEYSEDDAEDTAEEDTGLPEETGSDTAESDDF